jgi:histidinol-phosphate aminotransferase
MDFICQSKTNLFFLTSPHAPSGKIYKNSLFSSVLDNYRGVLVIDEAYADFAPLNAVDLLNDSERLIITRTLSKSYSLAGLRVGYGLSSKKIISVLNRAREVYNVDRIAQYIAGISLQDRDYFLETKTKIINSREKLYSQFKDWGWDTYSSGANFLFTRPVDMNGNTGKNIARDLFNFLQKNQIFTRFFPSHILTESYLRISIGKEKEMDMLVNKLIQWQSKDRQT